MPDIAVCVPVYRSHDEPNPVSMARELPAALGAHSGEIIFALNGITAGAAGVSPEATVVDLGINRGVAPGWNAAAVKARADTLVFANDDVRLGPHSLLMLHAALAEHSEAGIVGPVGSRFDFRSGKHVAWIDTDEARPGELVPCDVVSGFLFAMRRRDFEIVGGFDEAYAPASMEEIDLTLGVRTKLGLGSFVVAGVAHGHDFGVSTASPWRRIAHNGRREFLFAVHRRNRRHFYRKWARQL